MKKRPKNDRALDALQRKADSQGVRLQQANARGTCTTDADCVDRLLKRGLKDREPIM